MSVVSEYLANTVVEDQAEANGIDHFFEYHDRALELAREAVGEEVLLDLSTRKPEQFRLEVAIIASEDLRSDTVPQGETFGYEVARNAFRWWNYRQAVLLDRADRHRISTPEEREHMVPPFNRLMSEQDIKTYLSDEAAGGSEVIEGNPLYVRLYAQAEADRIRLSLAGEKLPDPIHVEQQAAYAGLLNTLDGLLGTPAAPNYEPGGKKTWWEGEDDSSGGPNYRCAVMRTERANCTLYKVTETYRPELGPIGQNVSVYTMSAEGVAATKTLGGTDHMIDAHNALQLISDITPQPAHARVSFKRDFDIYPEVQTATE